MARILAIDYGLKRVGLAVTDPLQIIATPLITLATNETLLYLKNYTDLHMVEAFVMGMPNDLKDKSAPILLAIEHFIAVLKHTFPTHWVFEQDERYTSKIATASLLTGGFKKKDRRNKANIDKISATLILQSFLKTYSKKKS